MWGNCGRRTRAAASRGASRFKSCASCALDEPGAPEQARRGGRSRARDAPVRAACASGGDARDARAWNGGGARRSRRGKRDQHRRDSSATRSEGEAYLHIKDGFEGTQRAACPCSSPRARSHSVRLGSCRRTPGASRFRYVSGTLGVVVSSRRLDILYLTSQEPQIPPIASSEATAELLTNSRPGATLSPHTCPRTPLKDKPSEADDYRTLELERGADVNDDVVANHSSRGIHQP